MAAKVRRVQPQRTSIGVEAETKARMNQLKKQFGATSHDELLHMLAEQVSGNASNVRRPMRTSEGSYEVDISDEIDPIRAELAELRAELAAASAGQARGIDLEMVLADPESGALFDATKAPVGVTPHGTNGEYICEPKPGEEFAREDSVTLFASNPKPPRLWVRAPSGVYLTDRDDTLPEAVEAKLRARIRAEGRQRKQDGDQ
jgi:hypothetical protein